MADGTKIEWTRSLDGSKGATWNPLVGCEHVSPGCDHCYAARETSGRLKHLPVYSGLAEAGRFTGEVRTLPERLDQPLRWRRPRLIFVNSMSDLFHRDVPAEFIDRVWSVMARSSHHTFQVLTKRPQRLAPYLDGDGTTRRTFVAALTPRGIDPDDWPLPNVWLGTSIESDRYTFRADHLRATPAAVRWLSLEPLLGPLPSLSLEGIDWVVVGGESGPRARPCHPDWVRDIRDRCVEAGIPFLLKQWGEWAPAPWKVSVEDEHLGATHGIRSETGHVHELGHKPWSLERNDEAPPLWAGIRRVGKKAAGRQLDGQVWDQMPERSS